MTLPTESALLEIQKEQCTKQRMFGVSPLFVRQHFQAQNNRTGKKMTTTGNHIEHLYLQLLPVVKSLQNVVVRNVAALETVNVLSLAYSMYCTMQLYMPNPIV